MKLFREHSEVYAIASAGLLVGGSIFVATGLSKEFGTSLSGALLIVPHLTAFDQGEFWSYFAALFAIMNPVIAIPLLAGPGAIATIILQSQEAATPSDYGLIACVIGLMVVLIYAALRLAVPIARALGSTGLMVATRLLGMIVAAIAVEMMIIGLRLSFPDFL